MERFTEPILEENDDKYLTLMHKWPEIKALFDKAQGTFWSTEDINLSRDYEHWKELPVNEQKVLSRILAFFAASDGIVNENVVTNFYSRFQTGAHRGFYAIQMAIEAIHGIVYSDILQAVIPDKSEQDKLFSSMATDPFIREKGMWALEYMNKDVNFEDQVLAFICVEGIFFSASFLFIFFMKKNGVLPGICTANEYISRDEGLHCDFGVVVYNSLLNKSPNVMTIVSRAVELEQAFIRATFENNPVMGFNVDDVCEYIQYCANRILLDIGVKPIVHANNKFPWMVRISIEGHTNFFEKHSSSYAKKEDVTNKSDFMDTEF